MVNIIIIKYRRTATEYMLAGTMLSGEFQFYNRLRRVHAEVRDV
jgi:hypothetical protein